MQAQHGPPQLEGQGDLAGDSRAVRVLLPAVILAATFLAYAGTLALGFVFDDHVLIVSNDSIRSWRYFPSYFTSHIWSFRYPHLLSNAYRPFFLIWLRLNDVLFDEHAWGWHLSLVVAHIAVTYLVYQLCIRLTRDTWSAAAGALIFGLHPVHVETIAESAWADQPLSSFFMLAAILAFCRSREPVRSLRWMAASLGFTAAALLSKESGLMLPILVSGYVWIYERAGRREVGPVDRQSGILARLRSALLAAVPFWAALLLYVPLRIRALKGFTHVVTPLSLSKEILTLPSILLFYLRLLIWPTGLSCYYDTPYISSLRFHDFILPTAFLAVIAAMLAFWYLWTRRDSRKEAETIAFACLWMILTVLPVLNFRLLPENEIAHDRYIYLASVGFTILVAMALRQAMRGVGESFNRPAWSLAGALVLSMVMGWATASQSLYWADDLSLNFRAHQIAPRNVSATTSLAAAVGQRGLDGEAMALYRQALAIQPRFWRANVNLAYLEYAHGNYPEAARYFERACAADPTDGDQFLYFGMALLRLGRPSDAGNAIRTALLVRPQGRDYHLGLGMALRGEGKLTEAMQEIKAELEQDPTNAQARALLEEVMREMELQAQKPPTGESRKPRLPAIK
jgi:Flp pilus assembly protein TadD